MQIEVELSVGNFYFGHILGLEMRSKGYCCTAFISVFRDCSQVIIFVAEFIRPINKLMSKPSEFILRKCIIFI